MWFDGIGGCSIGGGGTCEYNQAKALLVADGWQVDYASSWRSLEPYRLMVMLAPNINGDGQLTTQEIADIEAGLAQGLRLIITAEDSLCQAPAVTQLLTLLVRPFPLRAKALIQTELLRSAH